MHLPEPIAALAGSKPYTCDNIGKSGSKVLCYEDMVLKIEPKEPPAPEAFPAANVTWQYFRKI